ncbi:MAG: class I tRNA ligase family protein, partial [Saprospiraceae bacterium]|nr:class I tRNA ligase family protein [Saprospiraceae bacterium]
HQIPAYYCEGQTFVAESAEEALAQAQEQLNRPDLTLGDLQQDEDVLDTWFSSWLWPFSVFDGLESNEEVDYYYPTALLATGWDIIFLWVARMIISGYEFKGERPFKQVYFHGMVRDKQRRKMSKSLGNSPDAMELLDRFGADGVRFGMMSCSPAGADLLFDEKLCEQGRNFCNKMWNALRLLDSWRERLSESSPSASDDLASTWMSAKVSNMSEQLSQDFTQFRLSDGLIKLYSLIWSDFCSWYLEMIKPKTGDSLSRQTWDQARAILLDLVNLLHPFMPFITEEIWATLKNKETSDCVIAPYPQAKSFNQRDIDRVEFLKEMVTKIRDLRNQNGIKAKHPLMLQVVPSSSESAHFSEQGFRQALMQLASLEDVDVLTESPEGTQLLSAMVSTTKLFIPYEGGISVEEELAKFKEELTYHQGFVKSATKKLSNERFVQNAPEAVVAKERKKLADGEQRIQILLESIARLEG